MTVRILSQQTSGHGWKHIHYCTDCCVIAEFELEDLRYGGPGSGTFCIKCPGCKSQIFKSLERLPDDIREILVNPDLAFV